MPERFSVRAFRSRDRFFCEHQKGPAETPQDYSAAFVCDHIAVKAQCRPLVVDPPWLQLLFFFLIYKKKRQCVFRLLVVVASGLQRAYLLSLATSGEYNSCFFSFHQHILISYAHVVCRSFKSAVKEAALLGFTA